MEAPQQGEYVLGQIDLVALVLACLPMNKHKIRLQLVSKTWKKALESPAAHSTKTKDLYIPFGGLGISRNVTQVLSQCHSNTELDDGWLFCDGWLGPGLQRLRLRFRDNDYYLLRHFLESLPIMPRLGHLELFAREYEGLYQYDFSEKFPSLETLIWSSLDGEAPSYLERLTSLKKFEFHLCDTSFNYNPDRARGEFSALAKGCEITLSAICAPSPVPDGLISQTTHIDIFMDVEEEDWPEQAWQDDKPLLDFSRPVWPTFSLATSLKAFKLMCESTIVVQNIGILPRCCKRLEFHCLDLQLSLADVIDNGFRFGEVEQSQHAGRMWVLIRA